MRLHAFDRRTCIFAFFVVVKQKEIKIWKTSFITMPCCMLKSDLVRLIALLTMKVNSLKSLHSLLYQMIV